MASEPETEDFAGTPEAEQEDDTDQHAKESEEREAYEYWGYLFKPDRTGTDKLKALLRALKDLMNDRYDKNDHPGQPEPDLTPTQLAHFYRDLHGNYDQLFLGSPHESIAFIYKSLGCLHSLQPAHHTHALAFTDPAVPALKTEGWIMWQTIQLLLGPEEHSGFLREAVSLWDVKDPVTGDSFPKVLPRKCFPETPDKHMVAWYEGVSERLRKEAEDEERQKTIEARRDRESPPPRRPAALERKKSREDDDDTASLDSRATALAYFRNPLYRRGDGRPSIVRGSSRRPGVSPRPSMMVKGKEAASTFGNIVRNVGSPHLWNGGGSRSGSASGSRRRRSTAETPNGGRSHLSSGEAASPVYDQQRPSSTLSAGGSRTRNSRDGRPGTGGGYSHDGAWDDDRAARQHEKRPSVGHGHSRQPSQDLPARPSRSRDPTPNQKEHDRPGGTPAGVDYFTGYDDPPSKAGTDDKKHPSSRHSDTADAATAGAAAGLAGAPSHNETDDSTPTAQPGPPPFGISFEPSTSPLFAAQVARQPQPFPPPSALRPDSATPVNGPLPNSPSRADFHPSVRRARDEDPTGRRYSNTSPGARPPGDMGPPPPPGPRRRDDYDSRHGGGGHHGQPHHHSDRHRHRPESGQYGRSPGGGRYPLPDDRRGSREGNGRHRDHHGADYGSPYREDERDRRRSRQSGDYGRHIDDDRRRRSEGNPQPREERDRRDYSPVDEDRADPPRESRPLPKQTRFADEPDDEAPGDRDRDRRYSGRDRDQNRRRDDEYERDEPAGEDLFDTEDEDYDRRRPPRSRSRRDRSSRSRSRSRRRT